MERMDKAWQARRETNLKLIKEQHDLDVHVTMLQERAQKIKELKDLLGLLGVDHPAHAAHKQELILLLQTPAPKYTPL
jgi:hypothetical protein